MSVKPVAVRKRPVEVEAMQLTESNAEELSSWAMSTTPLGKLIPAVPSAAGDGTMVIHTLEGTMLAQIGDWIVRGVKGEFYPVKPEIFEQTYEVVSDGQ